MDSKLRLFIVSSKGKETIPDRATSPKMKTKSKAETAKSIDMKY